MKLSEYEQNTLNKLAESIHSGDWSNEGMVQIIELVDRYLNLKTISDYAKQNNISYNGAKKFRKHLKLFNTKFIIDNE